MKIALGMSGGVDSSAAAIVLKNKGFEVLGTTLCLFDGSLPKDDEFGEMKVSNEAQLAAQVCEKLGIEHKIIDGRKEFYKTVITDFVNQYYEGFTPNPCIVCNKKIKFGFMLEAALNLDCEKIATGHYARIEKDKDRYLLKKAKDSTKDQSYVLYPLKQSSLSRTEFPLGDYTKEQIREIAREIGLINADKKDSQDICFVPEGDYADFIQKVTGKGYPKGEYVNECGTVLGVHSGIINYTIGQRKGLKIALGKPQFVLSKDARTNRVVLGDESSLFHKRVVVKDINMIAQEKLTGAIKAKVKLRYRHTEQPATLHPLDENQILIEFDAPQRAPSPGQSAVFYDSDIVLGGGIIV
ncbi:MAG: tRNA 2-thiouridine(34) synthase MnmA [Clostridia bacterium]|nr:tRNA 2-thiouridine(34) synthase MnmA [Clostridia bacterium]